jgi:hypothetical protein
MTKRIYEPPMGRDLSCIRANGGFLSGEGGGAVQGVCGNGSAVTGALCTAGTRVTGTSSCLSYGFMVGSTNYCSEGQGGSSGCVSGTYVNT